MRLTLKDGTRHIVRRIVANAARVGTAFAYLAGGYEVQEQIGGVVEFDWSDVQTIEACEGTEGSEHRYAKIAAPWTLCDEQGHDYTIPVAEGVWRCANCTSVYRPKT